ncbi:MAG: hypothetical protein A2166_06600 [Omnitrophica WOR_2 bacterium RBG_13_41_10]|nr:MAG: hypothetical protein A2166_06600 [Omnitrophica WOR_2 bacterium RBG_13_41_10]
MEGIIVTKKPKLKDPCLICAWPGMGEVAFKAASYLANTLKAVEFASILPQDYFYLTGSLVKNGILDIPKLPSGKFYYWKNGAGKNDLIIFISDAQPDLTKAEDYCNKIISLAKSFKVKSVISFAAMPQAIDHTQQPGVWFVATSPKVSNNLKKFNLSVLLEGQISGMNGLFLGVAKEKGLEGFCLLGEIPLYTIQIDNPKASYAVLEALSKILGIRIGFTGLVNQAQTMEGEINKLLDYLKIGSQAAGPISEEEIEKIKKSLGQLTKLPFSIKERIEQLFNQAKADISKARELKAELDKWSVYKEYEDRFLDLFKKKKDENN